MDNNNYLKSKQMQLEFKKTNNKLNLFVCGRLERDIKRYDAKDAFNILEDQNSFM